MSGGCGFPRFAVFLDSIVDPAMLSIRSVGLGFTGGSERRIGENPSGSCGAMQPGMEELL